MSDFIQITDEYNLPIAIRRSAVTHWEKISIEFTRVWLGPNKMIVRLPFDQFTLRMEK